MLALGCLRVLLRQREVWMLNVGGQCCVLGSSHRWSAVVHFCRYLVPSAAVLFIGSFKDTDWFGAKGMAERVRVFHKHEDLSLNP